MSWLALLLIGIGAGDLARERRASPRWWSRPALITVGGVVIVVPLTGLTAWPDLLAAITIGAIALGWRRLVDRPHHAWSPPAFLGAATLLVLGFGPWASPVAGPFAHWLAVAPLEGLREVAPNRVLLIFGGLLIQFATGNILVRSVLAGTGTAPPDPDPTGGVAGVRGPWGERGRPDDDVLPLKGGRLLGPLERVFILALGLAGHVTAASIIVAAKGLLRFPELNSHRADTSGPGIDVVTEYFLLGTFVSWTVSLVTLVLLV